MHPLESIYTTMEIIRTFDDIRERYITLSMPHNFVECAFQECTITPRKDFNVASNNCSLELFIEHMTKPI